MSYSSQGRVFASFECSFILNEFVGEIGSVMGMCFFNNFDSVKQVTGHVSIEPVKSG